MSDALVISLLLPLLTALRMDGLSELPPFLSSLLVVIGFGLASKLLLHAFLGLNDIPALQRIDWKKLTLAVGVGCVLEIAAFFLVLRPTGLVSTEFPRSVIVADGVFSGVCFVIVRLGFLQKSRRFVLWSLASGLVAIAALQLWARWIPSASTLLRDRVEDPRHINLLTSSGSSGTAPILVMIDRNDPNVFARYITEILKAEGVFSFETVDLASSRIDQTFLKTSPLVITAAGMHALGGWQDALTQYTQAGGSLLMLNPPQTFDTLLGIKTLGEVLTDGYISLDTSQSLARFESSSPLQFHGPAQLYALSGSRPVAWLCEPNQARTAYPAIGIGTYEKGRTAFFAFDLGRSIVLTRQGKPPGVTVDRDGDGVFRAADLFFGSIDGSKAFIPQADEQQRLFVRIVMHLLNGKAVLPHVWYFPNAEPAVAVVTGDAHGTPVSIVDTLVRYVESRGGHFTLFEYPTGLDSAYASDLSSRGHDVEPHIYYPRPGNRWMQLRLWVANWFLPGYYFRPRFFELYSETHFGLREFKARTGRPAHITRDHYLLWWGWSETAELFADRGIRMDLTFTGSDPEKEFRIPGPPSRSPAGFGYINGSGLPMRFIDAKGRLIPLLEQVTVVEDDVLGGGLFIEQPGDSSIIRNAIQLNQKLIDQSISTYHTALVYNFHPEHAVKRFPPNIPLTWEWVTKTIDYLSLKRVPMLSASEWAEFVEGRYGLSVREQKQNHDSRKHSFEISSLADVKGLTFMFPVLDNVQAAIAPRVALHSGGKSIPTGVARSTLSGSPCLAVTFDLLGRETVMLDISY